MNSEITFPFYCMNVDTHDYFKYSSGNKVLQFNLSCINSHATPFLFFTESEYISFLKIIMERRNIVPITKEKFDENLKFSINWITTEGAEPKEFWTKEKIKENNEAIKNYS